jgi:hypothetical protein
VLLILLIAALLAVALPLDWTILAALLVLLTFARAGRSLRDRVRIRQATYQR